MEQQTAAGKMNRAEYNKAETDFANKTIKGKPTASKSGSEYALNDMTPTERARTNKTAEINNTIKSPAPRAGLIDARTNKPYVPTKAEKLPLKGPIAQGSANPEGKGSIERPASAVFSQNKTTTVKKTPSY